MSTVFCSAAARVMAVTRAAGSATPYTFTEVTRDHAIEARFTPLAAGGERAPACL